MKKTILPILAVLTLSNAVQAQYSFTAGDGKIYSSKLPPLGKNYSHNGDNVFRNEKGQPVLSDETYATLEKDFVRFFKVSYLSDGSIHEVMELLYYFTDLPESLPAMEPVTYADQPDLNSVYVTLASPASISSFSRTKEKLQTYPYSEIGVTFQSLDTARAFFQDLRNRHTKNLKTPGFTPTPRVLVKEATLPYEALPAPMPAAPKKLTTVTLLLKNLSKYDVKLTKLDSPGSNSSQDYLIPAGSQKRLTVNVGGLIRTRNGVVLLKVTEGMHNIEQVIAR